MALKNLVTPRGRAKFPHLNAPDTKFAEGGAGTYHTKLLMSPEDAQPLIEEIDAVYEAAVAEVKKTKKLAKVVLCDKPYRMETDRESGEETGLVEFTFKRNAETKDGKKLGPPAIYDAKGTPVADSKIGGGSVLKCSFVIVPFPNYTPKVGAGVKLALNGVQIIDLKEFGGRSAASLGFGQEDDGYTANAASGSFEDETSAAPAVKTGSQNASDF